MRRLATTVRQLPVALCVAIATTIVVAQNEPAQTPPPQVFRGTVDFVYVDAYPRQGSRLVEGLQAQDFEVFEDGKAQRIETFEFIPTPTGGAAERRDPRSRDEAERWIADPKNRVFIVYLDLYHISRAAANAVRGPLMAFLSQTIGPTDVIAVMTPETPVSELVFARTLNTLSAEIARYWEWGLLDAPIVPRTPAEGQLAACSAGRIESLIRKFREITLMTSLDSVVTRLGATRDERTSVIFLSEGWRHDSRGGVDMRAPFPVRPGGAFRDVQFGPSVSGRAPDVVAVAPAACHDLLLKVDTEDLNERFKQLLRRANAGNVGFYTIDVGGLRTYQPDAANSVVPSRANMETLQELAENTDGTAAVNTNDLGAALERVTESLSGYYLLGYYTTNANHDGKYRRIEVNVRRKDVQVTARRGYMAPTDGAVRGAEPRVAAAPVPPTVADAIGQLSRLSPDAGMFGGGVVSPAGLDIVAELASRQIESGRWRNGADVRVELTGADGAMQVIMGRIDAGQRSVSLHLPAASVARGPWQAYIGIVGGGDALADRIMIAAPATGLLGDPRIFRGSPNTRLPLQPAAAPLFQRGERVRVEWPLLKPLDQRLIRVLDRRGQPLAREAALTEITSDAGPVVAADVNLANLAEGDYLLALVVGAGTETEQRLLPLRLGR